MSKIVKITNTTSNKLLLCYRMPSPKGERANPILEVEIFPRALLQEVIFASDNMYKEFISQNQSLIDRGTIIIGDKTTSNEAEKISEANNQDDLKKASEKVDKNNAKLTSAVSRTKKAKVEVAVEKQ